MLSTADVKRIVSIVEERAKFERSDLADTDAIERIAVSLANGNDVEGAWYLRGALDRIAEVNDPPDLYAADYMQGRKALKG